MSFNLLTFCGIKSESFLTEKKFIFILVIYIGGHKFYKVKKPEGNVVVKVGKCVWVSVFVIHSKMMYGFNNNDNIFSSSMPSRKKTIRSTRTGWTKLKINTKLDL